MGKKIGIVGARVHGREDLVRSFVRSLPADTIVVSGGGDGVDTWVEEEARAAGLALVIHRPKERCREAYLARNALIAGDVAELHTFPWLGCRGTHHTAGLAAARGVPVIDHPMVPACVVHTARWGLRGEPSILNIMRGYADKHRPSGVWARMPSEVRLRQSIEWAMRKTSAGATLLEIQKAAREEGVGSLGEPWAPSSGLLGFGLAGRRRMAAIDERLTEIHCIQARRETYEDPPEAEVQEKVALRAEAESLHAEHWDSYAAIFRKEMLASYRVCAVAWGWLLAQPKVVLACLCDEPAGCHRSLVAGMLVKLGAKFGGEIVG